MKDIKVEQNIDKIVMLTKQINDLCKKAREDDVVIRFNISYGKTDPDVIAVASVSQSVLYEVKDSKKLKISLATASEPE